MRNNELNEGIDVVDDKNNVIGTSKVAAKKVKLNCWHLNARGKMHTILFHLFSSNFREKVPTILSYLYSRNFRQKVLTILFYFFSSNFRGNVPTILSYCNRHL
jgi:hypothetical protein